MVCRFKLERLVNGLLPSNSSSMLMSQKSKCEGNECGKEERVESRVNCKDHKWMQKEPAAWIFLNSRMVRLRPPTFCASFAVFPSIIVVDYAWMGPPRSPASLVYRPLEPTTP
ncbi:hypothetical protein Ddc_07410 [Ditylenchus destructor]|nr:hypothetical protein Ddc_07410 [Ditylenchus destructor]